MKERNRSLRTPNPAGSKLYKRTLKSIYGRPGWLEYWAPVAKAIAAKRRRDYWRSRWLRPSRVPYWKSADPRRRYREQGA